MSITSSAGGKLTQRPPGTYKCSQKALSQLCVYWCAKWCPPCRAGLSYTDNSTDTWHACSLWSSGLTTVTRSGTFFSSKDGLAGIDYLFSFRPKWNWGCCCFRYYISKSLKKWDVIFDRYRFYRVFHLTWIHGVSWMLTIPASHHCNSS